MVSSMHLADMCLHVHVGIHVDMYVFMGDHYLFSTYNKIGYQHTLRTHYSILHLLGASRVFNVCRKKSKNAALQVVAALLD